MSKSNPPLKFEKTMDELEVIIDSLEHGELTLDDALKQFEKGIKLIRESQTKLDSAQQKVAVLMQSNQDPLPMDPGAEG